MHAVVLVGGFGTRLQPLTLDTPKQMLPVVGIPMIEHVVGSLGRQGVDEVTLSLGYRPDAFMAAYPDGRCAGVALHYAVEPEPLDTAGAIRFAAEASGIERTFVVVNGDVLSDLAVDALVADHRRHGGEGTIALTPVEDPSRYGVVATDEQGRVTAFVEKPPADEAPSRWINAGTYVLEPEVLARIAADRRVSIEREVFPAMVADRCLYARADEAYWVDAGTPATYLQVQLDLIDGCRGPAPSAIDPTARIDPNAEIHRSVVGSGVHIAAGAQVRNSVLLAGSHIRTGARVVDSIVGVGAVVGADAVVAELSVLGDGQVLPDDAELRGERVPAPC